ncbi:MAG: GreA/GreB family elongation factor, partial [Planctomycetota bacterium]
GTTLVDRGAHNETLLQQLFGLLEKEFSNEDWYALAMEVSHLGSDNMSPDSFKSFLKVRYYTAGSVLYHRAGWGECLVEELNCGTREVRVKFASGKIQEFPLTSALDSLRPLPKDDLRAMRLTNIEELQRLALEEPPVLIRKAAAIFRGKINSTQLKSELTPTIVPAKKWASFWKKAKSAAASDPWLQVEGSTTRPVFLLRKKPLSLAEEAERSLAHVENLGEALAVCREYLGRNLDPVGQELILDLVQQRVEVALEKQNESHAHILDGILLLEEVDRHTSISAGEELRTMLIDEEGELDPEAFTRLATNQAREQAVSRLPEALGETWGDQCIAKISRFPTSVLEPMVLALQENGQAVKLVEAWGLVAPYPRRHPVLTYLLGRLFAEGSFDDSPDKPDLISVGRVMLHLARVVASDRKGNPTLNRLRTRLTSLLTGRLGLLDRCLETIGKEELATYLGITERGGDDFPVEISDTILRVVARKFPDLTAKPERPFWEQDEYIYCTSSGLARQREEYRLIVEEKIPANSAAIGTAASHGDLSENSEWDAAMEEQRNLTSRADMMDKELRCARALEEQNIPEGVICPGALVRFTYLDTHETEEFKILGPWDCVEDGIINYRAPIAAAFLGKTTGEQSELDTPEGKRAFHIDSVEKIL